MGNTEWSFGPGLIFSGNGLQVSRVVSAPGRGGRRNRVRPVSAKGELISKTNYKRPSSEPWIQYSKLGPRGPQRRLGLRSFLQGLVSAREAGKMHCSVTPLGGGPSVDL